MIQDDIRTLDIQLPEDVLKAKYCGDFDRAQRLLDIHLADPRTPRSQRPRLAAEKEILARLPLDFTYTPEQALALVQRDVPDFSMEELTHFMDISAAEWIYIQGRPHLATRFYETLLKVNPDIARRAGKNGNFEARPETVRLNETMRVMQERGELAHRIHLRAKLRIKDEAFRPGERVRVHLPIPAPAANMRNIQILRMSEGGRIGEESDPQRTVYFERTLTENETFFVEYAYDCVAKYVAPQEGTEKNYHFDLQEERPHIVFTPTVRALCEELAEGEKNPLALARRFYDFCTTKVKYSFMREYFTITQIPEYAATGLKGDCGVQALLFITLCRCAGIPARWQSGLYVTPEEAGCHDWAQFYVEPYGWLFADPSFGGSAYRNGNEERWNHYFGNLDPYRMVANSAFQAELKPAKKQTRIDPYDNQTGEVEYEDRGLLRSEVDYSWDILEHEELK